MVSTNQIGSRIGASCQSLETIVNKALSSVELLLNGLRWLTMGKKSVVVSADKSGSSASTYVFSVRALSFFLLVLALQPSANAHSTLPERDTSGHPKDEFSRYFIIKPQVYHGRYKRALSETIDEQGVHASHITLSYVHDGKPVVADLKLNEQLIPEGHFLRFQQNGNAKVLKNFNKTDINLCHYQGAIRGRTKSHVAVSTCNGINGLIHDGSESYYIYSEPDGKLDTNHYIFKNSDILYNATCGVQSDHGHKEQLFGSSANRIHRYKRSKTENIIRGPYNANRHSSYVELVIVVDNKVFKALGENLKKVHNHCKDIANIVNALYVPLNIFVALVGVVVWNEANEIELSSNGDDTLKNFLHYRRNSLLNHPNDNAQLLTKEQFEGGVVGKALKGPICTYEYSGGVSMEHSSIVAVVATTVAHEMGHNFGMEHDTSDCKCEQEKCIMSASSTSTVPRYWSSCSIDQLNVAFSHGMNYCLRNKPTKLFESPQCGNGFVELGEQCDCGLPEYCENSCCDPNTCMLNANASCATGECCDLSTCRPKSPGTECRSAEEECDLPEYCTGESEFCPTDVYKRDTEVCDNGNAYCYKGSCRSRSNQCKILWGPSGESSDHCYDKNIDGSRHGNCGYDRLTSQYIACAKPDVHCGMLHCKHLNERLEFGMESVAILSHSFMNHEGTIIPCRTAIVDLGLQSPDPGLAPNGAQCGKNKMCVDQKCVSIEALEVKGVGPKCPNDCSNQGTCNSKGHCHCKVGYAPPDCQNPGQGGSIDSGPASNPNARIGFTRAMYIFFLGIVPCIAIVSVLTYYWKQNHPLQFRKPSNVTKVSLKPSHPPPRIPPSGPNSPDDMNSALLKSSDDPNSFHNSMFGKFKGFTLKPLPNSTNIANNTGAKVALVHPVAKIPEPTKDPIVTPIRAAPPVPKRPPDLHKPTDSSANPINAPVANSNTINRPVISEPVLKTSTCTAKELDSLNKANKNEVVFSMLTQNIQPQMIQSDNVAVVNKEMKEGTIKRIASFLKNDKKMTAPLATKPSFKAKPNINREQLKNIKISSPIPIVDDNLTLLEEEQAKSVQRTQSMRNSNAFERKQNIPTFGSMRQPDTTRPKSLVAVRPKSPPPRPPVPAVLKPNSNQLGPIHTLDNKRADATDSSSNENIYADIDEIPFAEIKQRLASQANTESDDSMGLLGEIVSEMKKINGEGIYTNTPASDKIKTNKPSLNTTIYDTPTNNAIQAAESVRTPIARVAPSISDAFEKSKPSSFSSFKNDTSKVTRNENTFSSKNPDSKPKVSAAIANKPIKKYGSQPKRQITNPTVKKTQSSTSTPTSKSPPKLESQTSLGANGKKNLVSQRAEFWENNTKDKTTAKAPISSNKPPKLEKPSNSVTSFKPVVQNTGVKVPTEQIPKKGKSVSNRRKSGDSQTVVDKQAGSSLSSSETKNNKHDNSTSVRFASNPSIPKPNNSASA